VRRPGQDYDLAFPSAIGTPLDGTNVYHAFKRLLKQAGLPTTYRVHDLRHSTATYLLAPGVDPRIVMQIMGWSQVSMLKRATNTYCPRCSMTPQSVWRRSWRKRPP
jgi:site-specific recombinase XerD